MPTDRHVVEEDVRLGGAADGEDAGRLLQDVLLALPRSTVHDQQGAAGWQLELPP
jgi:hypothetical protein